MLLAGAQQEQSWESGVTKGSFLGRRFGVNASRIHMLEMNSGEVNPAAWRLERHPVDALPPASDHDPVPRRLRLKQRDFMAHGTSDRCPGCRALVSGGRAQGHTEECRIRVEGELRKTAEAKARLRAAASRAGDASTGRALKSSVCGKP